MKHDVTEVKYERLTFRVIQKAAALMGLRADRGIKRGLLGGVILVTDPDSLKDAREHYTPGAREAAAFLEGFIAATDRMRRGVGKKTSPKARKKTNRKIWL